MHWLWFAGGLSVGASLGAVLMGALVAGKQRDDLAARRQRR